MKTPTRVERLWLEACCCDISLTQWERWMKGATRADKRRLNVLVKTHLPELYESLSLHLRNPYTYYKTNRHLVLVHSAIEYFLGYRGRGGKS